MKFDQIKVAMPRMNIRKRCVILSTLIATVALPLSASLPDGVAKASATRCVRPNPRVSIVHCHYTNGTGTRINYSEMRCEGCVAGGSYRVRFTATKNGQELASGTVTDTTFSGSGYIARINWNANFPDGTQICATTAAAHICNEVQA